MVTFVSSFSHSCCSIKLPSIKFKRQTSNRYASTEVLNYSGRYFRNKFWLWSLPMWEMAHPFSPPSHRKSWSWRRKSLQWCPPRREAPSKFLGLSFAEAAEALPWSCPHSRRPLQMFSTNLYLFFLLFGTAADVLLSITIVTRSGDLLGFGQLFKAFGNN